MYQSARTATHVSVTDALLAGVFEQESPAKVINLDSGSTSPQPASASTRQDGRQKPTLFRRFLA